MTTDQLRQARSVFARVVDLPPNERDAAIHALPLDPDVAQYVRTLLAADAEDDDGRLTRGAFAAVTARAMEAGLPAAFDTFTVVREVGRGGMGIVYEAQQSVPRRRVALKTWQPLGPVAALRDALHAEVDALACLSHPSIPAVHALVEVQEQPVLVMAFIDGTSLEHAADNATPAERFVWLEQLASALQHAHQRGVTHRDVKPSNILITPERRAVLIDFGIAALQGHAPLAAGTHGFSPPEQLDGDPSDVRGDVYGLGAVAQFLLNGIASTRRMQRVLARATHADPNERYPTATMLNEDLLRVRDHRPLIGERTSALERLRLATTRHRTAVLRSAVGIAVIAAAVWGGRHARQYVQDQQRETGAQQAFTAIHSLADRLGVQSAEVRAAFDSLVQSDLYAHTAAVSDAWRWHAEHHPQSRQDDLLAAWAVATTDEQSEAALAALVPVLLEHGQWRALDAVLDRLPPNAHTTARIHSALASRDLDTAHDLAPIAIQPVVDLLRHAQPMPSGHGIATTSGTAVRRLTEHVWVQADGTVTQTWPQAAPAIKHLTDGHSTVRVVRMNDHPLVAPPYDQGVHQLQHLLVTGESETIQQDVPLVHDMLLADVDGDGNAERVDLIHRLGVAVAPTIASPSEPLGLQLPTYTELRGFAVAPLATGPALLTGTLGWDERGVRLFQSDDDGWTLTDRLRCAPLTLTVVATASGEHEVIVLGREHDAAPGGWRWGPRPGARLIRARVSEAGFELIDTDTPIPIWPNHAFVADINHDGLDDVLARDAGTGLILVQRQEGGFTPVLLPDVQPVSAADVDGDGDLEVWLSTYEGEQAWLAGVPGAPPLPAIEAPLETVPARPAVLDAAAVTVWERGLALQRLGLHSAAARVFLTLTPRDDATGTLALAHALALVAPDDPSQAAVLARQLLDRPTDLLPAQREQALAVLRDVHDVQGLAALGTGSPPVTDDLLAGSHWGVDEPLAVSRAANGPLQLRLTGELGPLLHTDLAVRADIVRVEMDAQALEQDFGSGLVLSLQGGGEPVMLYMSRESRDGAFGHDDVVRCSWGNHYADMRRPADLEPRALWLSWSDGAVRCGWGDTIRTLAGPSLPDQLTLQLSARSAAPMMTALRLNLSRLTVLGALAAPSDRSTPLPHGFAAAGDVHNQTRAQRALTARFDPSRLDALRTLPPEAFLDAVMMGWWRPLADFDVHAVRAVERAQLHRLDLDSDTLQGILAHMAVALIQEGRLQDAQPYVARLNNAQEPEFAMHIARGDTAAAQALLDEWLTTSDPGQVEDQLANNPQVPTSLAPWSVTVEW